MLSCTYAFCPSAFTRAYRFASSSAAVSGAIAFVVTGANVVDVNPAAQWCVVRRYVVSESGALPSSARPARSAPAAPAPAALAEPAATAPAAPAAAPPAPRSAETRSRMRDAVGFALMLPSSPSCALSFLRTCTNRSMLRRSSSSGS